MTTTSSPESSCKSPEYALPCLWFIFSRSQQLISLSFMILAISAFRFNRTPILVTPGTQSQCFVYFSIPWQRLATNSYCSSGTFAYLYARYGSWPCYSSSWNLNSPQCSGGFSQGFSSGEANTYTFNGYSSGVSYSQFTSPAKGDLVRSDYLYIASFVDSWAGYNCTAKLNVTFEYCPANTIVSENYSGQTSQCVPYTNISGLGYSQQNQVIPTPSEKYYLIQVPENASNIKLFIGCHNPSITYQLFGRFFSGGQYQKYYKAVAALGNTTLLFPNPPSGDFVINLAIPTAYGISIEYEISIEIQTCPDGSGSDANGNCVYSFTRIYPEYNINNLAISVPPSKCNMYGFLVQPWTWAFINWEGVAEGDTGEGEALWLGEGGGVLEVAKGLE